MFRTFIKEQLAQTSEPELLVIGETHNHSSALIGLAHCVDDIKKSGKNVIVITEDLQRQKGIFGGESSYNAKDVNKALAAVDGDIDAIQVLLKNKVKVYGVESEKTAPTLFLKGKTKEELYNEAVRKMPYLFEDIATNTKLTQYKDDKSINFDDFKELLNRAFASSDARLVNTNNEIVAQMLLAAKDNPGNTLIIFCGGASHLAAATNIDSNKLVHEGILAALQNAHESYRVSCCYFTSKSALHPNDSATYTPKPENPVRYDSLPNLFIVPPNFALPGTPLDALRQKSLQQESAVKNVGLFGQQNNAPVEPRQQVLNNANITPKAGR